MEDEVVVNALLLPVTAGEENEQGGDESNEAPVVISMFVEAGNKPPITRAALSRARQQLLSGRMSTVQRAIELIRLFQCDDPFSAECLAFKFTRDERIQRMLRMFLDHTEILIPRGARRNRPNNSVFVAESLLAPGVRFLVKYVDSTDDAANAPLEVAIGLYGVNALKQIIPNFSCVYGYVGCTAPVFADEGRSKEGRFDWCRNIPQDTGAHGVFVVGEYVHGYNVQQLLKKATSFSIDIVGMLLTSILLGVFAALVTGERRCGFTHYDLKTDNIVVRDMGSAQMITYPDIVMQDGKPLRLMARFVPVIIDYGLSRIDVNINRYFGMPGGRDEPLGVSIFKSFIDYNVADVTIDAYKLIMDLWYSIQNMMDSAQPGDTEKIELMQNMIAPLYAYFTNDAQLAHNTVKDSFTINSTLLNDRNVPDLITIMFTNDVFAPYMQQLIVRDWTAPANEITINFPQNVEQLLVYESIRRVFPFNNSAGDVETLLPEPENVEQMIRRDLNGAIEYLDDVMLKPEELDGMDVIVLLTKIGQALALLQQHIPDIVDDELYVQVIEKYRAARNIYIDIQKDMEGSYDADVIHNDYIIPEL